MARRITPKPVSDKDGNVTWRVRFRYPDGRSTSRTFEDASSAKTFADLIHDLGVEEALNVLEAWAGAQSDTYTVTEWCIEHIKDKSGIQPDTRARYLSYVERDFARWHHLPLSALTPGQVAAWINEQVDAKSSAKTIANKHGLLADAMGAAVRKRLISSNPCDDSRLPRSIVESMVFLTHEEYAVFLDYFTPKWQPFVATLFATGMRWGEITALRVGDVDLDDGSISISRAWKADRTLGPPKSRKSVRTISLAPETVQVLEPLVEGRKSDEFLFTNTRGGAVRHSTFLENVWHPAVRLANGEPAAAGKRVGRRRDAQGREILPAKVPLGKRLTPHDARHTCASWLLGDGIPINWVQAHLGHESIQTTVDRYGHVMPASRQAIAGAMSRALTVAHPQIER